MKKLVSLILACLLCLTALPVLAEETAAAPKYVFLFIGDGMSYPQFQAAADYLDALADDDAEQVAIDFAKEHPAETLIVVTGGHETGGLTIGYAGTDYDTYLDTLSNQKISYARIEGTDQRALDSAFTADGVYYSTNYVSPSEQTQTAINAAISAATWQGIPAASSAAAVNLSYWPEWATRVVNNATQGEYYGNVWKIGADSNIPAVAATTNNAGVNWGGGMSENPDLDKIRLIVRGGIIVGYNKE